MQSFRELGLKGIKEYPRVFSALEEFERTKRIPKFTYRKRIDVTIDEHLLKKFKQYCQTRGLNMSRTIEKHIKEELLHAK